MLQIMCALGKFPAHRRFAAILSHHSRFLSQNATKKAIHPPGVVIFLTTRPRPSRAGATGDCSEIEQLRAASIELRV